MVNANRSLLHVLAEGLQFPALKVPREVWKERTRNLHPNAMSLLEAIGDAQQINRDFADFPRLE